MDQRLETLPAITMRHRNARAVETEFVNAGQSLRAETLSYRQRQLRIMIHITSGYPHVEIREQLECKRAGHIPGVKHGPYLRLAEARQGQAERMRLVVRV
jgi:hypothetical protein